MPNPQTLRVLLLAALLAPACDGAQRTSERPKSTSGPHGESFRVAIERQLPALDGSRLKLSVYEVTYQPGGYSTPHHHTCPVIGYVIEGAYRTQVRGEKEMVYTAGQSFYEAANGAHVVSANASADKPVRFLAYFTCDRDTPLMQPVPDSAHAGRP